MRQLLVLTSVTFILAAGLVWGQPANQPPQRSGDPMSSMWNPEMMINRSVQQASRRYNLTPEQEEVARKLTTDGVNAFLDKHESELRSLIGEALRARMSGQPPTAEEVKKWTERAAPLFEEAKKAILEGNRQFREVLTDEQKKGFDADQKLIEQQFAATGEMFERWKKGDFDPVNDWIDRQRPRPDWRESRPELDRFERYARRFIDNYKLDSTQATQVMSIVADSRKRAEEYWYSRKTDIEAARARVRELASDLKNRQQYLAATKQLTELNKPVNDLYNEMRRRLDVIPTDAQRKAFEASAQARRVSSSTLAVSATMGVATPLWRSRRVASRPSTPGIWQSMKTRS